MNFPSTSKKMITKLITLEDNHQSKRDDALMKLKFNDTRDRRKEEANNVYRL
jgi:hypothetical protein